MSKPQPRARCEHTNHRALRSPTAGRSIVALTTFWATTALEGAFMRNKMMPVVAGILTEKPITHLLNLLFLRN
ncbi:hypothetical protein NOS3756_29830 [Nostoc sp. NIES-3756]|uniref:hypothetical protein n=1 Tax=Nostoc sp. NIES-3756 TaxID=1751286 RepID=UPI0007210446|nr:hypothetical protein [Nostoc sp. NIES-3756]BAT54018.1 hypothetical protein NOS3756_29830 [Nostoc sp. NIES-3756]